MKPPAITIDNPVIKTTTVREIVTPNAAAHFQEKQPRPDYWEFVRALTDEQMGEFAIYLTREDPGRIPVDSTMTKYWEPPGHGPIWIGDQEALEMAVARVCGGGGYRLALKKRKTSEWICDVRFRIDMAPRQITPWYFSRPLPEQGTNSNGTGARVYSGDGTTQIANKAIETIAGHEHAAVSTALNLFDKAADTIAKYNPAGMTDPTVKRFMDLMIERGMNPPPPPPPPDPIDLLARILSLQAQLNPTQASGNPIMGKIMDVALTRLLEPINSAPAVSAGAEIVRSLPSIFAHGVEIAREWRMGQEAQRDGVMAMQQPPPMRPGPPPPRPIPQPQVLAPTVVAPNPNPVPSVNPAIAGVPRVVPPSAGFVDVKIMEMFLSDTTAEEAAEETYEFLSRLSGDNVNPQDDLIETLGRMGEQGLHNLFQNRALLQPANAQPERLRDFIRAFLRLYEEEKKEAAINAKPN